jgi:hypothetical protein
MAVGGRAAEGPGRGRGPALHVNAMFQMVKLVHLQADEHAKGTGLLQ